MNDEVMQEDFANLLALAQEQMRDMAVMNQRRSELTAKATAAGGLVEVTVDAQRRVAKTVIDESYLNEFEFADLSGHITTAAQQAHEKLERQAAALLAPLAQRREEIRSFTGLVADVPEFGDLLSGFGSAISATSRPEDDGGDPGDVEQGSSFPIVRS